MSGLAFGLSVAMLALGLVAGVFVGQRRARTGDGTVARRRAEEEAEPPVNRQIMQAVENLPLGLVLFDLDGQVVFENAAVGSLGEGRHQRPLFDAALAETAELAREHGTATHELDLFGPPRQLLEFSGRAVFVEGAMLGHVIIVEDVTEHRRSADVRRDFVANVSHELKTPVGAMGLLAEALIDNDDPAVTERLSSRLHAEAIRLGNTIDDLLALSEIESGVLQSAGPVDPHAIVEAALQRSRAAAELRSIEVTVDVRAGGLIIEGDRRQLIAAVGNLLDNAVKYSEPNSAVQVVVSGAASGGERGGDWSVGAGDLMIEIIDHGVGIPEADRERIFERFYRVDPARSRGTGGTGLGLSIVRNVVRNHNGRVELESAEGEGSTFRLILPLVQPDDDDDDDDDGYGHGQVVVVEHDADDDHPGRSASPPARMAPVTRSPNRTPLPGPNALSGPDSTR